MCPKCCGMARWYGSGHGGRTWQSGFASTRGQNDTGRPCQLRSYTATVALLHVTLHSRQSACKAWRDCVMLPGVWDSAQHVDRHACACTQARARQQRKESWRVALTVVEDCVACQHPYTYGRICEGKEVDSM